MPPANQEHAGAPSRALRSSTSTATPRSASSSAQVRPATPAPMTVTRTASALPRSRRGYVQLAPTGTEFRGHVAHTLRARFGAHLVRDAHGAELRSAHRAEMRHLVALLRQRRIVEGAGRVRVEREVELVLPAEIEARPRQRIVARPGPGVALGKVGSVSGDLVSDDAGLDVVAIRKSEVFLGRDVAQHGGAEPTDHGGSDRGSYVVVTGRDVGRQGTQGIERRFAAGGELLVHVLLDLVHRHVARSLAQHLAVVLPGHARQLAEGLELGELRGIVGIGDGPRAQTVAEREAHVIRTADRTDFLEVFVQEALAVMRQAPLRHDRSAARDDAGDAPDRERDIGQPYAGVDGEVVHALLGLL